MRSYLTGKQVAAWILVSLLSDQASSAQQVLRSSPGLRNGFVQRASSCGTAEPPAACTHGIRGRFIKNMILQGCKATVVALTLHACFLTGDAPSSKPHLAPIVPVLALADGGDLLLRHTLLLLVLLLTYRRHVRHLLSMPVLAARPGCTPPGSGPARV